MILCYTFQFGVIFCLIVCFQVVQVIFLLDVFAAPNALVFIRLLCYFWPVIACLAHGTCLFIKETTSRHYDTKVNHKNVFFHRPAFLN